MHHCGGSLGDVVRKLGERVTSVILPIFENGIDPAENAASKRQGICLGMLEVIRASTRRQPAECDIFYAYYSNCLVRSY